ncbi:hypothetical protein JYT20_00580 [Rhodothermus sp. AH-315-K08]|nr:hypothetical protein [Rhodothermus sp. AH-315-K08]
MPRIVLFAAIRIGEVVAQAEIDSDDAVFGYLCRLFGRREPVIVRMMVMLFSGPKISR